MIICCGEALIDMLPRKLQSGEDVFLPVSGGAIFNTAITLGGLGAPSSFLSGISTDIFGEQLIASLEALNVETPKPVPELLQGHELCCRLRAGCSIGC